MENTAAAAKWARPAHSGGGVTLALPCPLPYGVAAELLEAGLKLKLERAHQIDTDTVAVLMDGPSEAKAALLAAVAAPKSRGSRTEGNLLPH